MTLIDMLALGLAVLQMADLYTTYRIFKGGGGEKNPVGKWFIDRFGLVPGMAILKGVALSLTYVLWLFGAIIPTAALVAFYLYAVRHNWRIVRGKTND